MGSIVHFFGNVDLRCQHDGLSELCKKEKIDVKSLQPGEFVVFVNHQRNRVKVLTASNVLAYLRLYSGHIDLRVISRIPEAFQGPGKIDYDKALKEFVESNLVKKGKLSPLEAAKEIKKVKEIKTDTDIKKIAKDTSIPVQDVMPFSLAIEEEKRRPQKVILRKTGDRVK